MKKTLLFAAVIGLTIASTSCTKDYTCTFTEDGVEMVEEFNGLSSEDAEHEEEHCDEHNGTWKEA